MSSMFNSWQLPTSGITGRLELEMILAIGLTVIVFGLGFISGNQR